MPVSLKKTDAVTRVSAAKTVPAKEITPVHLMTEEEASALYSRASIMPVAPGDPVVPETRERNAKQAERPVKKITTEKPYVAHLLMVDSHDGKPAQFYRYATLCEKIVSLLPVLIPLAAAILLTVPAMNYASAANMIADIFSADGQAILDARDTAVPVLYGLGSVSAFISSLNYVKWYLLERPFL